MKFIKKFLGIDQEEKLRRLAEAGDTTSAYQLALSIIKSHRERYENLSEEDEQEVRSLLEKAAKAGMIPAAYELGERFGQKQWLRHAARNGHLDAAVSLSRSADWLKDSYSEDEMKEVYHLASEALQAGNQDAAFALQNMMFMELGCQFQPDEYFRLLAEDKNGYPMQKARLAWCYILGIGTQPTEQQADMLFREILSQSRVDPLYNIDTESPDVWLYLPSHPRDTHHIIPNVAKYIVHHLGGAIGFSKRLEASEPEANFIAHLAASGNQIPPCILDGSKLLRDASGSLFPPAMFRYATSLPVKDEQRAALIAKAAHMGYVPAQLKLASLMKSRFGKVVWKTLVFAQESHYGFRHNIQRENLDADMEDFVLRGAGKTTRESSDIILQPSELLPKHCTRQFTEILISNYCKYVKPFKPVSRQALHSACFNVARYVDPSFDTLLESHTSGPRKS